MPEQDVSAKTVPAPNPSTDEVSALAPAAALASLRCWQAALAAGLQPDQALRAVADHEEDPSRAAALRDAAGRVATAAAHEAPAYLPGPPPALLGAFVTTGLICGRLPDALAQAIRLGERRPGTTAEWAWLWWESLGALLAVGTPLLAALEAVGSEPFPPALREATVLLREDLREGLPLADAMRRQPHCFAPLQCALVAAAETNGTLPAACAGLGFCAGTPGTGGEAPAEPGSAGASPSRVPGSREGEAPAEPPAGTGTGSAGASPSGPAPEVALLLELLEEAAALGASEAHIHRLPRGVRVRARVREELRLLRRLDDPAHRAGLVAALKSWAGMGLPALGGRIESRSLPWQPAGGGPGYTLRVTIYPTSLGQAACIGLVPRDATAIRLDALGPAPGQLERVRKLAGQPCGVLLIAGPGASGRRTTAYSLLSEIAGPGKSTLTLEPNVPVALPGVEQAAIDADAGLTYAAGVRALLNQDPDVLYVASVADAETLAVCIEAATTGHLVLAGVQAGSALEALANARAMLAEPGMLSASLVGIIAQRLVRTLCPECARRDDFTGAERRALRAAGLPEEALAGAQARRAAGCEACGGSGYRGRTGIFEVMAMEDEAMRRLVGRGTPEELRRVLGDAGAGLRRAAAEKVLAGATTIEEAYRVAGL